MMRPALYIQFNNGRSLSIEQPSFIGIFGSSGIGKTQFVRSIAGFDQTNIARLEVFGDIWQSDTSLMPVHKRDFAMVFQDLALFDHLTVQGNLDISLKISQLTSKSDFFNEIIGLLEIRSLLTKSVMQLSGGERQRVALARALLARSKCLLLDEVLSALDDRLSTKILHFLQKLQVQEEMLILYISHKAMELAQISDQILHFENDQKLELLSRLEFMDQLNQNSLIEEALIKLTPNDYDEAFALQELSFSDGQNLLVPSPNSYDIQEALLLIHAEHVSLSVGETPPNSSILNHLEGKIVDIETMVGQSFVLVQIVISDQILKAKISQKSLKDLNLQIGDYVWASVKSATLKN